MQVVISSENTNKRRLGLGWGALFQIRYSGKPESDKTTTEKKLERSKDLGCTNIKDKSIPARENSMYKGPEVEADFTSQKNSKEMGMSGLA